MTNDAREKFLEIVSNADVYNSYNELMSDPSRRVFICSHEIDGVNICSNGYFEIEQEMLQPQHFGAGYLGQWKKQLAERRKQSEARELVHLLNYLLYEFLGDGTEADDDLPFFCEEDFDRSSSSELLQKRSLTGFEELQFVLSHVAKSSVFFLGAVLFGFMYAVAYISLKLTEWITEAVQCAAEAVLDCAFCWTACCASPADVFCCRPNPVKAIPMRLLDKFKKNVRLGQKTIPPYLKRQMKNAYRIARTSKKLPKRKEKVSFPNVKLSNVGKLDVNRITEQIAEKIIQEGL